MMRLNRTALVILPLIFAVPGCQRPRANPVAVTEHEVLVTEDNYDREVANASTPVLLDFSASWCPPCQQMAPIVQRVAEDYGDRLVVGIVDTDRADTQKLAEAFRVSGIPMFVILVDGEPVASTTGYNSEQSFRSWIDKHAVMEPATSAAN